MTMSRPAADDWCEASEEVSIPAVGAALDVDPASVPTGELQEAFRRLVLVYELGRQICSETQEDRVFETILGAVAKLLSMERGFIASLSGGTIRPRAMHRIELGTDPGEWPVSGTMLERVLSEG